MDITFHIMFANINSRSALNFSSLTNYSIMNNSKYFHVKMVLILTFFIVPSFIPNIFVSAQSRIVNGREAKFHLHPYMVSIQKFNASIRIFEHHCGGSLISPKFVISAGHCFYNMPKSNRYAIKAGTRDLLDDRNGRIIHVSKYFIHPNYQVFEDFENDVPDYDLSLVLLAEEVETVKGKIEIANLPIAPQKVPLRRGTVLGWGTTGNGESNNRFLISAHIPVIRHEECRKMYPEGAVTERMFCAIDHKKHKDSCGGDSGGPFVINGTVYGVVSWAFGCGKPRRPGVYTNISHVIPFIKKTLSENDDNNNNLVDSLKEIIRDIQKLMNDWFSFSTQMTK